MRVVIVGGGVAGAACAVALGRFGAEVTVYEAYPDPGGQVGVLRDEAVRAGARVVTGQRVDSGDESCLARPIWWSVRTGCGRPFGVD